jgi:hypothetical protein
MPTDNRVEWQGTPDDYFRIHQKDDTANEQAGINDNGTTSSAADFGLWDIKILCNFNSASRTYKIRKFRFTKISFKQHRFSISFCCCISSIKGI